ncbi:unnamed protein product [Rhizoctonia solani]|uniref:Uncharacterized protein n=1 Tax=Rhizoctonia solani TaxID=456999 RepID=A0A8H3H830_9AGAM|nr:unnamed protein product [Rhizoctonia solani]
MAKQPSNHFFKEFEPVFECEAHLSKNEPGIMVVWLMRLKLRSRSLRLLVQLWFVELLVMIQSQALCREEEELCRAHAAQKGQQYPPSYVGRHSHATRSSHQAHQARRKEAREAKKRVKSGQPAGPTAEEKRKAEEEEKRQLEEAKAKEEADKADAKKAKAAAANAAKKARRAARAAEDSA